MNDKLDTISDNIAEIKTDIALIKQDLRYHIKRTDMLEGAIKPVSVHVERMNGALKLLGIVLLVGSVIKLFVEFI